jgi:tRNA(Ile)-lysidine synthase
MHSFESHIRGVLQLHGVKVESNVIVAVSGGADSMALLSGVHSLPFTCIAAHVNYGLRGMESDGDEECVRAFCANYQIDLEVWRVNEQDWETTVGSTQEAARTMRYAWFEQLRAKHGAAAILTAHHANDQTETMLYQFVRGGAGKSVFGMAEKSGYIIRPLLAITKEQVLLYIEERAIPWRQDSSNDTTHYARNVVRHEWMPLIEQLNPAIHDNIQLRSSWMHQEQAMVDWAASLFLEKNAKRMRGAEVVSIATLTSSGFMDVVLWKWLSPFGFSSHQVSQIADYARTKSSSEPAWFNSASHQVCIQTDRVACVEAAEPVHEVIGELPYTNDFMSIDFCSSAEVEFTADVTRQYLDAAKLTFPLTIRTWQEGDRFHPLGVGGHQTVADFMVHAKVPAWQKKAVAVLCSSDDITAVLQYRISEKFKISTSTNRCVRIQFF